MKGKRLSQAALLSLVVLVALLALAACQKAEQLEEDEPTLEAAAKMTLQPAPSPTPPEPTQATTEEPTEEPTEQATPDVEPVPSQVPATAVTEMEEYVSATEFFSVKVPAGWSSGETFPGGAFIMANSEGALERFKNDHAIESGDLVLNVGFLPFELFRQREVVPLDIQFDATPDLFLQSLLPMFRISEDAILSEPELVSLSDDRDVGLLTALGEGREGLILMFSAGDEVVGIVSAVGFPGELDAYRDIVYAVAAEVTFSGAQDVLYRTFLGG